MAIVVMAIANAIVTHSLVISSLRSTHAKPLYITLYNVFLTSQRPISQIIPKTFWRGLAYHPFIIQIMERSHHHPNETERK